MFQSESDGAETLKFWVEETLQARLWSRTQDSCGVRAPGDEVTRSQI